MFLCERWLDSGEDDGKIIRELYAENDAKPNARNDNCSRFNFIGLILV